MSAMRRILASLSIESSVLKKFEAQDITPEVVQNLSDAQLFELGVTIIGKRQLWRYLYRESRAGNGKQVAFYYKLNLQVSLSLTSENFMNKEQ